MMEFKCKEAVEVSDNPLGPFRPAVLEAASGLSRFVVRYMVNGPTQEVVEANVRPKPPGPPAYPFPPNHGPKAEFFINGAWWVATIHTGEIAPDQNGGRRRFSWASFDINGTAFRLPGPPMRYHLLWIDWKWVFLAPTAGVTRTYLLDWTTKKWVCPQNGPVPRNNNNRPGRVPGNNANNHQPRRTTSSRRQS